jgi:predicted RNA-binding protein with PUA-like domain
MPNYWLIKSEPYEYSWQQLQQDKRTDWTGVRNYAARNNLRAMQKGDLAFFYHSNEGQEIVGIAKLVQEHFVDPTSDNPTWSAVGFAPHKALKTPVKLGTIKQDPRFAQLDLVRLGRLSVGKVSPEHFATICAMGGVKP